MRQLLPVLVVLMLLLAGCEGSFDQRLEDARSIFPGETSTGTVPNANTDVFLRGVVHTAGVVRNAAVVLRPVDNTGNIDWNDDNILGAGTTFANGVFHVSVQNRGYRGTILVHVHSQLGSAGVSDGGNPATAVSQPFHTMQPGHMLLGAVPYFDGGTAFDVVVTPLTTVAVMRGLAFDGSIAGVNGGLSAGMFGMCSQQVAAFFGLPRIFKRLPRDFVNPPGVGDDLMQAYVLAALSQLAKDIGVANVFDYWLGMALDAADDGVLNGSIGFVPNTSILMPDLQVAGLLGTTLRDNYMDPANLERRGAINNTQITPGGRLDTLITFLDTSRDINLHTEEYDFVFRVPDELHLRPGASFQTRVLAAARVDGQAEFNPLGDSAGPGFVLFDWVSSAPGVVDVSAGGVVTVDDAAAPGEYILTLTVEPRAAQGFVAGPTQTHTIPVTVAP
jgi:hypothetical protein